MSLRSGSSENRLERALRAARMVAWEHDPATSQVFLSGNVSEVLGVPTGTTIVHSDEVFRLVHEDDVERHRAVVAKAIADMGSYVSIYQLRKPDGSIAWLEDRADAVFTSAGAKRLVGVTTDVTKRKHLEEQLADQHRSFHELVERAPFGIYVVDQELRIASMNAGSQTGAFANVRPVIGHDFAAAMRVLWSEEVAAGIVDRFRDTLETGRPYYSRDFFNARNDIDEIEGYEWELHRIGMSGGSWGVVCYYFDSTELRRAQLALSDSERRKDEFLSTLAHELRNPLAPITSSIEILRLAGEDPATRSRAVEVAARHVEHMVRLVDDLMESSRISQGKLELRPGLVDLAGVIRSALESSGPLIERERHRLRVVLPDEPIVLEADPVRISQVLSNLLNNAAKYTEPGGEITLATRREDAHAVIEVRDSGVGIPLELQPMLFQMFSQIDRTLGRSQGGLGIGLALVKDLVALHRGSVEVRSEGTGKGSAFIVRLPLIEPRASDSIRPSERSADLQSLESARIVVIDDNKDAADSLAMVLGLLGARDVQVAYDGLSGLNLVRQQRPMHVFLDLGMPGFDGYAVARALKEDPAAGAPTLIAVTGWGQAEHRAKALEGGFDELLVKPVQAASVLQMLSRKATLSEPQAARRPL